MSTREDTALALFVCLGVFLSLCGCIDPITCLIPVSSGPPIVTGHVYLDGKVINDVAIEAISANGTDHRYTVTDDNGFYAFNITPDTEYNVTATYQGLRHTIWPVYLPGDTGTFDINLTTIPMSTIEGSGYTIISISPFESKEGRYKIYNHTRWSGLLIEAKSLKDNTTITAITDSNGSYALQAEPDTTYVMTGYFFAPNGYPMAGFNYRNGARSMYSDNVGPNVTVGSNETAIVDYVFPMP